MTDAYIGGFCKTAEEHGVDPVALMKAAGVRGNVVLKVLNGLIRKTPRIVDDNYVSLLRHTSPAASHLIREPLTSSGANAAFKGFKAQELLQEVRKRLVSMYDAPSFNGVQEFKRPDSTLNLLFRREDGLRRAAEKAFAHPELNHTGSDGRAYPDLKRLDWLKSLVPSHTAQ